MVQIQPLFLFRPYEGIFMGGAVMNLLLTQIFLFLFTNPVSRHTITEETHAYLDNGIRALPRLSGAEEEQEEGAVR